MKQTIGVVLALAMVITGCGEHNSAQPTHPIPSTVTALPAFATITGISLGSAMSSCPADSKYYAPSTSNPNIQCEIEHTSFLGEASSIKIFTDENAKVDTIVLYIEEKTSIRSLRDLMVQLVQAYGTPTVIKEGESTIWATSNLEYFTSATIMSFSDGKRLAIQASIVKNDKQKESLRRILNPKLDL